MRVVVLHNPRSGRGKARALSEAIEHRLRERGHGVKSLRVGGDEPLLGDRLGSADALVLVGGDGTVSHAAPVAAEVDTPIYHAPTGNENLFARAFGMSNEPETVVSAIERGRVSRMDIGLCNQWPFLIMCSVGPDAGVIRRVAMSRTKAIGHRAYVGPVVREAWSPSIPEVSIWVDERQIVKRKRGMVVVGNAREYALGIDPCTEARVDDGMLDVVFFPMRTALGALVQLGRSRARRGVERSGGRSGRGSCVRIAFATPDPIVQMDGEHRTDLFEVGTDRSVLELGVNAGALPVIAAG